MTRARRGVVLMLVLWLIVALGAISAGVVHAARISAGIAANARAEVVGRAAAASGIEATVSAIDDTLARLGTLDERRDWLNALVLRAAVDSTVLGDGRFAVTVVDASARLDVNAADEASLQRFFSQFTDPAQAAQIARAIRFRIDSASGGAARGPLVAANPLRSLDELHDAALVPDRILTRAVQYLTVDGDGTINQRTASDTVLAAATGELRDEPARLLLISRGWVPAHPATSEIQAVYAISGNRLVFSHWRERVR